VVPWRWAPVQLLAIWRLHLVLVDTILSSIIFGPGIIMLAALVIIVIWCSIALWLTPIWRPINRWARGLFVIWKMPIIDMGLSVSWSLPRFIVLVRILISFMPLTMIIFVVLFLVDRRSVAISCMWSAWVNLVRWRRFATVVLFVRAIFHAYLFLFNVARLCCHLMPIGSFLPVLLSLLFIIRVSFLTIPRSFFRSERSISMLIIFSVIIHMMVFEVSVISAVITAFVFFMGMSHLSTSLFSVPAGFTLAKHLFLLSICMWLVSCNLILSFRPYVVSTGAVSLINLKTSNRLHVFLFLRIDQILDSQRSCIFDYWRCIWKIGWSSFPPFSKIAYKIFTSCFTINFVIFWLLVMPMKVLRIIYWVFRFIRST